MNYLVARLDQERIEIVYKSYIADSLYYQVRNEMLMDRFVDKILSGREPEQSGDEVVLDVMSRAGLRFNE